MRIVGRDWVALAAFGAAALFGGWIALRTGLGLRSTWSDGERRQELSGEGIRYAVWDLPEPVGLPEDAAHLALSPDGRFAVFSVGEPGLNADLWVAEVTDGDFATPSPLVALNSPFDELTPALGHEELFFASNRAGEGFDLWRAPFGDGIVGAPERLEGDIASASDELDPCPVPGTRELLFASNRPRDGRTDFDLYRGSPAGSGWSVAALALLATRHDEREPTLSPDARALVFASDRGSERGRFDLHRSFRKDGSWLPSEPIEVLNSERSERSPCFASDAFSLLFAIEDEAAPREFARARSLEVFRVPPPPPSFAELLFLVLLAILGLLAWLSRRWKALDVLYKCFLVSVLVHLLLLIYLREVHPEPDPGALGASERTFRVRLEGTPQGDATRERAGELGLEARAVEAEGAAPARLPSNASLAPAAPVRVEFAALAREDALPDRDALLLEPAADAAASPEFALRETIERESASAPALSLDGPRRETGAPARALSAPERAASSVESAVGPPPAPSVASLPELRSPEEEGGTATRFEPSLRAPRARAGETETPAVHAPHEAASADLGAGRSSASFDPLADLVRAGEARGPESSATEPVRLSSFVEGESELAAPEASPTVPSLPALPGLEPREPETRARERLASAPSPAAPSAGVDLALRIPAEGTPAERGGGPSAPSFAALEGLARAASAERAGPDLASPGRFEGAPADSPPRAATPLVFRAPERSDPGIEDRPRLVETPYKNRFGAEKLRALEEFGGSVETEHAVAAGLAYLARIQDERGFWGDLRDFHEKYGDVRVGKTGLALLAFLGAGHTSVSGTEHSEVVERAIRFLLAQQDAESGHFGASSAYDHGIATYALAECFAITKEARLSEPLERAVAQILRCQSRETDARLFGGWGYYQRGGDVWPEDPWPRVSVSAWQVMALESASLGGLSIPEQAFEDARAFLTRAWDPRRGAFRYDHDPGRLGSGYPILPASTPAAIFALSLLGADVTGSAFAPARRFVLERAPDGYRYTGDDDFVYRARGNLYFWYYGTLAMFRAGGSDWERWNAAMKDTLLPAQEEDGSWRPLDVYAEYAGDDERDRAYTTAMCVLALEIYYRYFTPLLQVR